MKNRTNQTKPIRTKPFNDLKEHLIDQSVWENQDSWSDSSGASLYIYQSSMIQDVPHDRAFSRENIIEDTPLQKPVNFSAIFLKLLTAIVHVPTIVGNHATPLHSHTSNPL